MHPLNTTASSLAGSTIAAAGQPSDLVTLGGVLLAALAFAAVYLAACLIWPFTNCGWCGGGGRKRSPTGKAWRLCRHCKGTGARVRLGRQLWTSVRTTHRKGTRPIRRARTWRDSTK